MKYMHVLFSYSLNTALNHFIQSDFFFIQESEPSHMVKARQPPPHPLREQVLLITGFPLILTVFNFTQVLLIFKQMCLASALPIVLLLRISICVSCGLAFYKSASSSQ